MKSKVFLETLEEQSSWLVLWAVLWLCKAAGVASRSPSYIAERVAIQSSLVPPSVVEQRQPHV